MSYFKVASGATEAGTMCWKTTTIDTFHEGVKRFLHIAASELTLLQIIPKQLFESNVEVLRHSPYTFYRVHVWIRGQSDAPGEGDFRLV